MDVDRGKRGEMEVDRIVQYECIKERAYVA